MLLVLVAAVVFIAGTFSSFAGEKYCVQSEIVWLLFFFFFFFALLLLLFVSLLYYSIVTTFVARVSPSFSLCSPWFLLTVTVRRHLYSQDKNSNLEVVVQHFGMMSVSENYSSPVAVYAWICVVCVLSTNQRWLEK